MTWTSDACSLVEAYRAGRLSPVEATQDCLDAIGGPLGAGLNAFCHVDAEAALTEAKNADTALPFGGVPVAIKELENVTGWPFTMACMLLQGTVAAHTSTHVRRLEDAGIVKLGQTTSPEAGLVGYTASKIHGITRNPWDTARTPGGSSGGSAAAVAAGLAPIGTGSDGGGSIRIPAGYCGLVGLKTSFRRIPFGPPAQMEPLTSTVGCLSRSVRDTARWLDACCGPDARDPFALPRVDGWEAGLGGRGVAGLRVAVVADLGIATVHPDIAAVVEEAADALVSAARLRRVDAGLALPQLDLRWALPAVPAIHHALAPLWPACADDLTDEIRQVMEMAPAYDAAMAGLIEPFRLEVIEGFARAFDTVDLIVCATNPDDPYPAEGPSPARVGDRDVDPWNAGRLTMGANIAALPAISVPAGLSPAGLPVGVQIIAPRFRDDWLLDLALALERARPWPLVAPVAGSGGPLSA